MVEVSTPSSRAGLDSNSSCQTCLASRARTFIFSRSLSEVDPLALWFALRRRASLLVEDRVGGSVRRAVLQQSRCQVVVLGKGLAGALSRELGHDLGGLVLEPVLSQLARGTACLEVLAMGLDRGPKLFYAVLPDGRGGDDGWLPRPFGAGTGRSQAQHSTELHHHPVVALQIGLVNDEDIGDLEDACLDHLHAVAKVRCEDHDGGVGDGRDLELRLADADGFQDHLFEAKSR